MSSLHFWAILVAHTGYNWGFYMLLTELPTYMSTVLHLDMKTVIQSLVIVNLKQAALENSPQGMENENATLHTILHEYPKCH